MIRRLSKLALIALLFGLVAYIEAHAAPPTRRPDLPTHDGVWYIGGYLPESPDKKVWVRIKDDTITGVLKKKPRASSKTLVIETDDWLFPGLVDLHNHLLYNILPLWPEAKGQFNSRFEWRSEYAPYAQVKKRIRPFKDKPCAATRWAELKAVVSGVTAIAGVGGISAWDCARNFGPLNVEIPGELGKNRGLKNSFEVLQPALVGKVYLRHILPRIKSGMTYDQAYEVFVMEHEFDKWVSSFQNQPHTLENGAILTFGSGKGMILAKSLDGQNFSSVKKEQEFLRSQLEASPFSFRSRQITDWISWMYGDSRKSGYLKASRTENEAWRYIAENGVYDLPRAERKYAGGLEQTRRDIIARLRDPDALPFVTHIAEGHPDDDYTKNEYDYYQGMDLAQPGTILVHGVGMTEEDFANAAANDVTLVWSPFSNLLLYGETMNIEMALKKGVNVAMGPDWSPTGSKSLLDEMRLAWEYIRARGLKVPAKAIADMTTVNAAKAVGLDNYGLIKKGHWANLTVVRRRNQPLYDDVEWTGYHDLVTSYQRDIQLVVIAGHPMYGEIEWMAQVQKKFGTADSLELLPFKGAQVGEPCEKQKALWLRELPEPDLDSAQELQAHLQDKIDSNFGGSADHWTLDTLFACEDKVYRERFFTFIPEEWPENKKLRKDRRRESNLKDNWHPFDMMIW
ncbi:MAG: amidohydrolase family protein [Bdellovibrionaceae bacterium]|nr:amidohydrolase family protein [Bdellovibrionales bacterium]MCB9082793.1 amidohydrolase family protein [Pseudobdellovibrionaceae bacterium]